MCGDKVPRLEEQEMQVSDALQILCLACNISLYSVRSCDIKPFEFVRFLFFCFPFLSPASMNTD